MLSLCFSSLPSPIPLPLYSELTDRLPIMDILSRVPIKSLVCSRRRIARMLSSKQAHSYLGSLICAIIQVCCSSTHLSHLSYLPSPESRKQHPYPLLISHILILQSTSHYILQVVALLSYIVAYFPGGTQTLRFGGQMALRGAGSLLPI